MPAPMCPPPCTRAGATWRGRSRRGAPPLPAPQPEVLDRRPPMSILQQPIPTVHTWPSNNKCPLALIPAHFSY